MWTLAFIAVATGVLIWLGRSFVAGLKEGGYAEARAEEARRDLEAAHRQEKANAEALEVREAMRRASDNNPDGILSDDDGFRRD